MASAILTWIPVNDGNSTDQKVEYKLNTDPTYTIFSTVAANVNTETVTGLATNVLYSFKILNDCPVGGTAQSNLDEAIVLVCPSPLTLTPSYNSIFFSFNSIAGDISSYVVQLLNTGETTVLDSQTFTSPTGVISGTFPGLTTTTPYKVRIIVNATGLLRSYSKTCTAQASTTTSAPACGIPGSLTATMG